MDKFTLDSKSNSVWPWYFYVLLSSCIVIVLTVLGFQVYLWQISGNFILLMYLSWVAFLSIVISSLSYIFSKGGIHVHHYFWALIIMSICGHQNTLSTVICAITHGIFIEGCCRWSMDPVWEIGPMSLNDSI